MLGSNGARWLRPLVVALLSVTLISGASSIGLQTQAPQAAEAVTGQIVDLSPERIVELRAQLRQQGQQLVDGEEGLAVVPLAPAPAIPDQPLPGVALNGDRIAALARQAGALPAIDSRDPAALRGPGRPMIAIVIDDLGLLPTASRRTIALPGPLTLAFLPYGDNLQPMVDDARARGHEILLHMPMEPKRARVSPGPNALLTGLSAEEQQRRLAWAMRQFTGFVGVNNHMGSAFTESEPGMRRVLETLDAADLFFLDSRTTDNSAARALAGAIDIPYAERDVFLDNHQEAPYVAIQLMEVEEKARRYGSAIAIGHPHSATIETLARWLTTLDGKGFELVPVSRIIARRQIADWRLAVQRVGGPLPEPALAANSTRQPGGGGTVLAAQ